MKVIFATPTIERPHPHYLSSLEASVPLLEAAGWEHGAVFEVGCPYISAARATMLRKALDAKADVVVFIDHDVSWKPQDLLTLIETDGDVVAGTYRFKNEGDEYMCGVETGPLFRPVTRGDGCIKAVRVPAGFLKVTKEAIDKFMEAYPELVYGPRYNPSVDLFNHGAIDRRWWGEDFAFSKRWTACGGELWIVPDLDIDHHSKDRVWPGNYEKFLRRQPGGSDDPARKIAA